MPLITLLWILLALADPAPSAEVVVLGNVQDAGLPQLGCEGSCCVGPEGRPRPRRFAASVALLLPEVGRSYLFDVTPDVREQIALLSRQPRYRRPEGRRPVDGVFLTHAHIGHYTGLVHFGFEAMSTDQVPVYCTERFASYLRANGPWSQLVTKRNIDLRPTAPGEAVTLQEGVKITSFQVPHRDEYSDTVGYRIEVGPESMIFLPDIDRWTDAIDVRRLVEQNDHVLVDATFYSNDELPGRDLEAIPHPRIVDTMSLLADLSPEQRSRLRFLHLNHSNPALQPESEARKAIQAAGFQVVEAGDVISLGE